MLCMSTYAERLAIAMTKRGMSPHTDQSELARRVGMGCKPQNIQHLLDPNKNAKSSKYTPRIAEVLGVDAQWLSYATGVGPDGDIGIDTKYAREDGKTVMVEAKRHPQETDALESTQRAFAEAILAGLSGAKLTKALAFLQDLDARPDAETNAAQPGSFVVEGGQPDTAALQHSRRAQR